MFCRSAAFLVVLFAVSLCGAQTTVSGKVEVGSRRDDTRDSGNVVVWLVPATPVTVPTNTYRLTQKNKQFSPHLLVITTGSTVEFPNKDPFFHNVFSVYNGTRFDLGLYESGSSKAIKFSRPGASYIFCNIHPEMAAVILAIPSPYYATTNAAGDYSIANVPQGQYDLKIWYERANQADLDKLSRRVTVGDNGLRADTIRITAAPSLAEHHKDKYGHDYDTAPSYKLP